MFVYYTSKHTSHLYIKAISGIFSDEIYIRVLYYANIGLEDKSSDFNISEEIVIGSGSKTKGTTTITHIDNYYQINQSGAGNYNIIPLPPLKDIPDNFEATMKVKNATSGLALINNTQVLTISYDGTITRYIFTYTDRYDWNPRQIANNLIVGDWYKVYLKKQGNDLTFAIFDNNDIKKGEYTQTLATSIVSIGLWLNNGQNVQIKELLFEKL